MARAPRAAAAIPSAPGTDAGEPRAPTDERPTIVFLHGTRLTGAEWSAQVASLGDAFHCLAPDLPGHGSAADIPFKIDGAAHRIADLIEHEAHRGRAVLVGLSLGGYVAMAVAAGWPDRVAGLAISGATAEPGGWRALGFRALATVYATVPATVLDRVTRWFFNRSYPPSIAGPIIAGGFWFAGGAVALGALVGERFKPRLAAYPGPTLIINGELDLFFRPGERAFAAAAVDPRRARLRRATHHANLDQPARFTSAIRRFAEQVGRTPPLRA
jgi:pimeloyl-ACP methyl ester carboxylesterase